MSQRGLLDETLVVLTSEMGRKPKIGDPRFGGVKGAGRDHWLQLAMGFLAGGGMRLGQAIGDSSANAERVAERPVHLQEVFATLYHNLGIDVSKPQLIDPNGRPQYLVDHRDPIHELV